VDKEGVGREDRRDPINPEHQYDVGGISCVDYAYAKGFDPLEFSMLRYLTRWRVKNGLEDLRKLKRCCEMLIKRVEDSASVPS
jgi:hypothetical protein